VRLLKIARFLDTNPLPRSYPQYRTRARPVNLTLLFFISEQQSAAVYRTGCPGFLFMLESRAQMETLSAGLPYIQIALSLLLIAGIVLQNRGASLGGAFGGDNFASTFYKRRGAEKFLFNATIVISILFVLSTVVGFFL